MIIFLKYEVFFKIKIFNDFVIIVLIWLVNSICDINCFI